MTLVLRAIFKYSGKTRNGARASETSLSGKANQLWQATELNKSKDLDHVPLFKLPDA